MENSSTSESNRTENIEKRVKQLEQQLATAQATIQTLISSPADNSLRRSEWLFAHSRDIILFVQWENGKILDANPAALKAYGYRYDEIIRLTIQDIRAPETHRMTSDQMAEANITGLLFETVHRRKDGSTFPVEVSSQGAALGGERYLISVVREISERKQGENERARLLSELAQEKADVQQRAEELSAIIEALHDPVMVYNQGGVITLANTSAVRVHGFDPSEWHKDETNRALIIRHPNGELADPEMLPSSRALQGEAVIGERYELRNELGHDRVVLVTATPLVVNGVQIGAVGVWHDITEQDKAEKALRESEARFSKAFQASPDALTISRIADGRILEINQRFESLFGVSRAAVIGKSSLELNMFKDPADRMIAVERLHESGFLRDFEVYIRTGQDEERPVSLSVEILTIHNEAHMLTVIHDLTERKRIEQALFEGERLQRELAAALEIDRGRLSAILEHLPVGVWIADQTGQLIGKNEQADRIWAGQAPLVKEIGQYPQYIAWYPQSGEPVPPHEYPVAQALQTGRPIPPVEFCIQRFDGTIGTVLVSAAPIKDKNDQILGAVGVNVDITQQHEIEETLREREEILRLALTAGKAGVWSRDLATHAMQWSDEYYRIFGFEPGSVEPSAEARLTRVHPDDRAQVTSVFDRALTEGTPIDITHRVIWPDGSVHWVRAMAQVFFDPQGKPNRMAGIAIDVTQQKQNEEMLASYTDQLARSNQDLQNFAFIASHDLQEPLRKIEAFGDALLNSADSLDERERNYLERMRKAAARMRNMVDGLLQLSRVNTQGRPFEPVDLTRIAEEVISDLHQQILRTGGQVIVGDLPPVEGDPIQLHQLLQNLVGNALKYHRQDTPPIVQVAAEKHNHWVHISVTDNGIGFDVKDVERMFLPFQRLVGHSEFEGSGMGLAICREIVERHGGEITVQSDPGRGSTFTVSLPVR